VTGIRKRTRPLLITTIAAVSVIGSYVPEWTDFNESDPGVTLIGAKAASDAQTLSSAAQVVVQQHNETDWQ
jgi:hypothetical protein